ncbi:hypothetical protein [Bythopirellula polymerisocia]|uniref:PEP-CTERM protein-sorting domain-containing protein n=1 Tax=Bythopirellula polymerisocia TaxID=2528003 RepID=A0A5C6CQB8_9BACT|nr:hypothetical protein [Bythopirellula polymerisocia]TWU25817.1 hypothetical protein Pla144_30290 [Bythopirellula polymerisocia]
MNRFLALSIILTSLLFPGVANADLVISALGQTYTENFNSFAGTAATIPANFTWSDSDFSPGGIYDASGAYINSNSTYALVFGDTSERAFGSKSPTSGTDFLNWSFINSTGVDISTFAVTWDVEQYSQNTRSTTVDFNYNSNGGGFTQSGVVGTTLTSAITGTESNLSSVSTTSRSVIVNLSTPLASGQSILFGWGIANGAGSGSNAHIGVDNLTVTAVPEPSAFLFGGLICGVLGANQLRKRMANKVKS